MADVITRSVSDGIARVSIDLPGESVNKVSAAFRDAFDELLRELKGDDAVRAVVILSDKPDTWIAGADIEDRLNGSGRRPQLVERRNLLLPAELEGLGAIVGHA